MSQFMVGTAGHIDHGKTTLIKALSGKDTDRLKEEQKRGISIVNGYSFLDNGEHRISIIDVPGHERFIKNMLAGMTAINYVLFVVAADEGVMPQTREHFEILRLLGIKDGLFLITKSDTVEQDMIDLVEMDIEDMVHDTPYSEWEVMPVSAYNEEQMESLRRKIFDFFDAYDEKSQYAPRYFIDRVFKTKGVGEIVTGSLEEDALSVEDKLISYPGEAIYRLKSMESHDLSIEVAEKNTRVALSLTGDSTKELERGDVLSFPGSYHLNNMVMVEIEPLKGKESRIKHNTEYKVYFGSKELSAKLIDVGSGYYELLLDDKTLLYHGQRAILRQLSPVETLAGVKVIDAFPPEGRSTKKDYAKHLREVGYEEAIFQKYPEGITKYQLEREMVRYVTEDDLQDFIQIGDKYLREHDYQALLEKIKGEVERFFKDNRLSPTMDREILLQNLRMEDRSLFDHLVSELISKGILVQEKHKLSMGNRSILLSKEEEKRVDKILEEFKGYGLEPPSIKEITKSYDAKDQELLKYLMDVREIVLINNDIFLKNEFVICVKNDIIDLINTQGYLEIADLRDKYELSRKYIVPLLEYFDRVGVTKRDGNQRVLTKEYKNG